MRGGEEEGNKANLATCQQLMNLVQGICEFNLQLFGRLEMFQVIRKGKSNKKIKGTQSAVCFKLILYNYQTTKIVAIVTVIL